VGGGRGDALDTPVRHVVLGFGGGPTYRVSHAGSAVHARVAVATGNPVGIRDCPAAVSGNERRHEALGLISLGSDGQ
jgi:hypothetical protein